MMTTNKRQRLATLQPRVSARMPDRLPMHTTSERRMTGSALQRRRMRLWSARPYCNNPECGAPVLYPDGFELDHVVALVNGGEDTEENSQILCPACHQAKTLVDLAGG